MFSKLVSKFNVLIATFLNRSSRIVVIYISAYFFILFPELVKQFLTKGYMNIFQSTTNKDDCVLRIHKHIFQGLWGKYFEKKMSMRQRFVKW